MPDTPLAGVAAAGQAPLGARIRQAAARLGIRDLSARAIPLAVSLVTFAVFAPALWNHFVEWDDHMNLFNNPHYRGLGWENIRWMFTSALMGHYIPITWLTFGLDYTLWGVNPFGYHLTNNLLHAANAALFYLIAIHLLGKATTLAGATLPLSAVMASLFFALHPLRAESVAWATERRDVLSGFFFLLTVLAYLKATESEGARRRRFLTGSCLAYLLALGSKSIVMTLPLVLVLLDLYPLRRLPWRWREWATPAARAALTEKIPYFALALAGAVTAYCVVWLNALLTSLDRYPRSARVGITGYSLWFYFSKTVLPSALSPLHELPAKVSLLEPRFLLSLLAVIAVTVTVFALGRRWPAGLAVWVYYGVVLGPVTGIVHSGHQLVHDRYSYLSCLGWALLVGAAVGGIARAGLTGAISPLVARLAGGVAAVWILALATLTWHQVQIWRDTETLWRYAVESDPACSICQNNVGVAYLKQKLYGPAKQQFELALALRPERTRVRQNLGVTLANLGDHTGAITQLSIALRAEPEDPDLLANLGGALIADNRADDGLIRIRRALEIKPDHGAALTTLGGALISAGQPRAAVDYLQRAAALNPDDALPHVHLARAYEALGRTLEAKMEYDTVRKLDAWLALYMEPARFTLW